MGVLGWIFFGLLAGLLARALTPGSNSLGCVSTLAVGVVGALLGGFLGEAVLGEEIEFGWDLKSFLFAVAGSIVLLLGLNALSRR